MKTKIRLKLFTISLLAVGTFECVAQENFDTLNFISNALQLSKKDLHAIVIKEQRRNKDVIFVMAESITPAKRQFFKEIEFPELTIIYSTELSFFHFAVNAFLTITKLKISKGDATIIFNTRTGFNQVGPFRGAFYFRKRLNTWDFIKVKLRSNSNTGERVKTFE